MERMPCELRDSQTSAIIGACMEVHRELGCGFLEAAYKRALEVEFTSQRIEFRREVAVPIVHKGVKLPCNYCVDLVCFGEVIVEVKAVRQLGQVERAQVINYLKAINYDRALLVNFGAVSLGYERIVLSAEHRARIRPSPSA
jgi:GxxExxY protein